MAHKPQFERDHPAGMGSVQKVYSFPNGRGASVVRFRGSYGYHAGAWEIAVLAFKPDGDYELDYSTPITNDVLGWQSDAEVEAVLDAIAQLPALEAA